MHELQAAAAVGQMGLVQGYETCFRSHGLHTAQVLLTHADLADRQRYLNARSTLRTLLRLGVIPVINENDTVVTDEIKFGDNDTLGGAGHQPGGGRRAGHPHRPGRPLRRPTRARTPTPSSMQQAEAADPRLEAMAGGTGTALARGGMLTKVLAARRAARSGAHTVIASGREPDVLVRLAQGERIGTLLTAQTVPLAARKQWLADHLTVSGQLRLDAGAVKALMRDGKSLLPVGVTEVGGEFERGEVVVCVDPDGREVARGLVNYSAEETRRIMRRPSSEIESILGYVDEPELIHRDNLVLL